MERAPCVRCGHILHTGEGRVTVSFTVDELAALVEVCASGSLRARMICAIGLLDPALERELKS